MRKTFFSTLLALAVAALTTLFVFITFSCSDLADSEDVYSTSGVASGTNTTAAEYSASSSAGSNGGPQEGPRLTDPDR